MLSTRMIAFGLGLASALASMRSECRAQVPDGFTTPPGAGAGLGGSSGVAGMLGTPGGVGPIVILMAPAVQTELKLTDEQKTKVFELSRDAGRRSRELFQSIYQSGGGNPQALMMAGARLRQENERAVSQILKPEQKDRVQEIMLRVEGPLAIARPEVAAKLGLSANQKEQIQQTMMQMMLTQRQQMMAARNGDPNGLYGPGSGAQARSNLNRLRGAAVQQIGRILNAKQRAAFDKMLGEPFDIAKIDPELARPAATEDSSAADPETARPRRGRTATPKRPATRDAADDATPQP